MASPGGSRKNGQFVDKAPFKKTALEWQIPRLEQDLAISEERLPNYISAVNRNPLFSKREGREQIEAYRQSLVRKRGELDALKREYEALK